MKLYIEAEDLELHCIPETGTALGLVRNWFTATFLDAYIFLEQKLIACSKWPLAKRNTKK